MPRFGILIALCALLLSGCQGDTAVAGADRAVLEATVGDAVCGTCHGEIASAYQEQGKAHGFYRLTAQNAIEQFRDVEVFHAVSNYFYTVYQQDGRFYQEEFRRGSDGQKSHRLVREMVYVVGSGVVARTYLTEVNGYLFELPLTWYTQARKWDFSPGYERVNGRFDRAIPDRCMTCHNGSAQAVTGFQGKFTGMTVTMGVTCEQCHGPGADHVAARRARPEAGDRDPTIVNPVHLSVAQQLDVCQQCHVSETVSFLRPGRTATSFRPGELLPVDRSIFVLDAETPEGLIAGHAHVKRLMASACFTQSPSMTCTTCHEAHGPPASRTPSHFNQTCQTCHAVAPLQARMATDALRGMHAAASNCYGCHMPTVGTEGIPHSSVTDHFIRVVRTEGGNVLRPPNEPARLNAYFDRDKDGAEGRVFEGMAYVAYGRREQDDAALRQGVRLLERALEAYPDVPEGHYLLGFARLMLGQQQLALTALETAVRQAPTPERLNTLAQALEQAGGAPARIEALYQQALAPPGGEADIRVNYGRFLETQRRLPEALQQYQLAAQEKPWLRQAQYNLGTARLQLNDPRGAEQALRQAVQLDPDYSEASANLGVLYAMQNNLQEAARWLREAVRANPRNADALANLALTVAQQGQTLEARRLARQALLVNPQQATAREVLRQLGG